MPSSRATLPGHEEALLVAAGDDPVGERRVVRHRPEVLPDAFREIGAARAAGVHRALRIGADDLHVRCDAGEVAGHAGDRAAGADAGHEVRHPPGRLAPDLGPRGELMGQRVGRVGVLVGPERAGDLAGEALGGGVVRIGVLGRHRHRAHHDLGAVGAQQRHLLRRDLVGHDEHAPVAALGGDDGEPHAGVARRRFDDRAPRQEQPVALGGVDHRDGGAVLRRAAGVGRLQLERDRCRPARRRGGAA